MAGIQISGLLSNSAFDWKSVVDQLIAVSRVPITKLESEKTTNLERSAAFTEVGAALTALQDAAQQMRADDVFSARTVTSDLAATTWKSSSVTGAAIGTYTFDVTQLATSAQLRGALNIGAGLASTADVSGLTLANLPTATAVTAGTFSVGGKKVTVNTTDSLQNVFDAIATATGNQVTAAYDPVADKVTLTQASGELVLGAANDTSNFLSVMKLANNGGATTTSTASLGVVKGSTVLNASGLRTAITAVDGAGAGTFSINGVSIAFNVTTDNLTTVLARITESSAGVTASYDSTKDRVVLANKSTGDVGIAVEESAGGILAALGLTAAAGGSVTRGKNAQFKINEGDVLSSASNTLDATVHGITGLSVTVNTLTKQTLQVESDTRTMQGAIENFVEKFNTVQDVIEAATLVTVVGAKVTSSSLSSNREVQSWARELRALAFGTVAGVTGTVDRLDDLGIDFDGTTSHLVVKDSGKLATALGDRPEDVESLFMAPTSGLVSSFYAYTGTLTANGRAQQSRIGATNLDLDEQIATLEARLVQERETLTNAFIRMLDAQSAAQSQNSYLTNMFFKNNSS